MNIASGTPFKGNPNFAHYTVSKGAVLTLTRVLARSMGKDGICVNCIGPGLTRSESLQAARGAELDEEEAHMLHTRAIPSAQQVTISEHECSEMNAPTDQTQPGCGMVC